MLAEFNYSPPASYLSRPLQTYYHTNHIPACPPVHTHSCRLVGTYLRVSDVRCYLCLFIDPMNVQTINRLNCPSFMWLAVQLINRLNCHPFIHSCDWTFNLLIDWTVLYSFMWLNVQTINRLNCPSCVWTFKRLIDWTAIHLFIHVIERSIY